MPKTLGALLLTCFLMQGAAAQTHANVATAEDPAIQAATQRYQQSLNPSMALFNGRAYYRYAPGMNSHAYFLESDWQPATIWYDGAVFSEVPALVDLVRDQLVIRHFNGAYYLQLVKEKVAAFTIAGHAFVAVAADSVVQLQPGFYEQLYNGTTMVLARHTKKVQERIVTNRVETEFTAKSNYYLRTGGRYVPVRNEKMLLAAFGEQRKAVQQYLRREQLRFRKDAATTLVKAAAYYDAQNQ